MSFHVSVSFLSYFKLCPSRGSVQVNVISKIGFSSILATWLPDDNHLCLFKDFFTNHSPYPLQHSLWTKRTSGFCASLPSLWPWSFIVPFRSSLAKTCAPVTAPEVRALRLTSWACRWTAAISAQSPSIETLLTPCGTNSFSSGFTLKILCFFVLQLWKTTVRQ